MLTIPTPLLIAIVLLVLFGVVAALFLQLKSRKQSQESAAPGTTLGYEAIPALLTPAERSFFGVLQQAVSSQFQIFAKVRVADIVRPRATPNRGAWQSAFNRISAKHVDFVICDPAHLGVVGVIELDDRSHEKVERANRDTLVDSALQGAGIPILRFSARQSYSPAQIQEQMGSLMASKAKATPAALESTAKPRAQRIA